MSNEYRASESVNAVSREYEAPVLTAIGDACEVVLGVAGGGFDGMCGMTDAGFEFEPDDAQPACE